VAFLSIAPTMNLLSARQAMNASFDPLHLVNTYGAFGTVSRVRDELVIEGTADDEAAVAQDRAHWQEYELPCKPGDPNRRPCLVSPYHYRLDWQMWFAAMPTWDGATQDWEPWLVELVVELLRGKAPTPLLAKNPFPSPDAPPRFVRIRLWRYEFTTRSDATSAWWKRRLLTRAERPTGAVYMRPMSVDDPELTEYLRTYRLR
jgi:hypothetical protein